MSRANSGVKAALRAAVPRGCAGRVRRHDTDGERAFKIGIGGKVSGGGAVTAGAVPARTLGLKCGGERLQCAWAIPQRADGNVWKHARAYPDAARNANSSGHYL